MAILLVWALVYWICPSHIYAQRAGTCPPYYVILDNNYINNCFEDEDCLWPRKCCKTSTGQECLLPDTSSSVLEKSGKCPQMFGSRLPNAFDRCSFDVDCTSSKKCCETVAGKTCMEPATETNDYLKPGRCPAIYTNYIGPSRDRCISDIECPGSRKCCASLHGKYCTLPDDLVPEKVGHCPLFNGVSSSNALDYCYDDYDCSGKKKCCQTVIGKACLNPENSGTVKPGNCPVLIGTVTGNQVDTCNYDADCFGERKCCDTLGGKFCLLPKYLPVAETKPGICPTLVGTTIPGASDQCQFDNECSGERKCCSTVAGNMCLIPNFGTTNGGNQREGKCPIMAGSVLPNPTDNCFSDSNCPLPRKCCDTIAGKNCLLPE
uniref:WAP domain-containing protein n=1 Tax=Trichuris muris TaxID=70415 RepID=A0A5S6QUC7_TRIMR